MTIIEIAQRFDGFHGLESQSGRERCWMDGWIEVPAHLEAAAWDACGYCTLVVEDDKLVSIKPTERPEPKPDPAAEVVALKATLTATDYQIIKCSEYQMAGAGMPYDLMKLHESRQALRDEINRLEAGNE